jgi:hypothetical protein
LLLNTENHAPRIGRLSHYRHRKRVAATTPISMSTSMAENNQPVASTDIRSSLLESTQGNLG